MEANLWGKIGKLESEVEEGERGSGREKEDTKGTGSRWKGQEWTGKRRVEKAAE